MSRILERQYPVEFRERRMLLLANNLDYLLAVVIAGVGLVLLIHACSHTRW